MRRTLLLAVLLCLAAPPVAAAAEVVPGRVVVGFAPGVDGRERATVRSDARATLIHTISTPREQVLSIAGDPAGVAARLESRPEVAYAEPDFVVRAQWAPNDPFLPDQWGLARTSTPRAWDAALGGGALVGVADTGVFFDHPDLGRLDPRGRDFVNGDADASDDFGHGTAVTGVIAATADNAAGIAGVAPHAAVLEAKVLDATGGGTTSDVAAAVAYLADQGARVINLSLGGRGFSRALANAITGRPDVLVVAAAGNANADNDAPGDLDRDGAADSAIWPCNLPAANLICVGAGTESEARASPSNWGSNRGSNWGAESVDLMAPGNEVLTTALPEAPEFSQYRFMDGTSFSAPMVAGAAALLYSFRPEATVADVRAALLSSADPVPAYEGITVSGGRLNVARALATLSSGALPPVVTGSAPVPAVPPSVAAPAVAAPGVAPTPLPSPSATPKACTVPRVKRLTTAGARRRLRAAGCRAGPVSRRYSGSVRRGRVVTSSPRPGARSRVVVGLSLSRGAR